MRLKKHFPIMLAGAALLVSASACIESDQDDYEDWRMQNDEFITKIDTREYKRVTPVWAPMNSVYIKWHNDTNLTRKNLVAMSTSTVNIKYEMEDINGKKLGNSYSMTTNGDSVYQSTPNQNIIGMWATMTTIHEGDSVTVIMPYSSAYGSSSTSSFQPYTNLIYHMKLMKVVSWEKP